MHPQYNGPQYERCEAALLLVGMVYAQLNGRVEKQHSCVFGNRSFFFISFATSRAKTAGN